MIQQVLRFGMVGVVGYIVDAGTLLLLMQLISIAPLPARILSFVTAASVTFVLNQRFTFQLGERISAQRWSLYVATTALGAVVNVGIYQAWILHNGATAVQLILGTALGSLVAMFVNFFVSRTWVFQPKRVSNSI